MRRNRHERMPDQHQHLPREEVRAAVWAALSRWQKFQIRAWGWLAHYTEAQWLKANGWTEVRNGWLLPVWHPHKEQAKVGSRFDWDKSEARNVLGRRKEPYDQNHAANSQRYHLSVVQRPAPRVSVRLPRYPAYVRWTPYMLLSMTVTVVCGSTAMTTSGLVHWSFCVATTISALVGWALARCERRDLELDYTEHKLRGWHEPEQQEAHDLHQAGGG